jgi:hypothetical protein
MLKIISSKAVIIICLFCLFHVTACKRQVDEEIIKVNGPVDNLEDLKIPNGFNYQTTRINNVKITLLDADGNVYNNAIVYIMDNSFELGGRILAKGITNEVGIWETKVEVPLSLNYLVINTSAINIPQDVMLNNYPTIIASLGGLNFNPKTVENPVLGKTSFGKLPGKISTKLGTWNISNGKPNYLEPVNDVISSAFLNNVNAFLIPKNNLPNRYPNLLDDNFYRRNILTTSLCDVYITFVKETAGQRNVLFYYTYNVNNPPATAAAIHARRAGRSSGRPLRGHRPPLSRAEPGGRRSNMPWRCLGRAGRCVIHQVLTV